MPEIMKMLRRRDVSELTEQENLKDWVPEEHGGGGTWLTPELFPAAGTWDGKCTGVVWGGE